MNITAEIAQALVEAAPEDGLEMISNEIRYKAWLGYTWTMIVIEQQHKKDTTDALKDAGFVLNHHGNGWYLVNWDKRNK